MTPINGSIPIDFARQQFWLLPDRAVWWPARSTLIVTDLHFGKAASFRSVGVPVPAGATNKDLARLSSMINQTGAQRLLLLGDFLHSRGGRHAEVFDAIAAWRATHVHVPIRLVRGNHDHSAGRVPTEWNIEEVDEPYAEDGIAFSHHPDCPGAEPTIAGHVHPVLSVQDYDGSQVSIPCFVMDQRCLILPAFGTFTGGHRMSRQPGRRLFMLAGGRVVAMRDGA